MAIRLRCCFCDDLLVTLDNVNYQCPRCHTLFKTKERLAQFASNPPKYIQDSIDVYKEMQMQKPKMTLAKHPMFTKDFAKEDVSLYNRCTKKTVDELQNNWHLIQEGYYLSAGISDMAITALEASHDVVKAFIPFVKCSVEKYVFMLMIGKCVSSEVKYNSHLALEYFSAVSMEQIFLLDLVQSYDKYFAGFSRITHPDSRDEFLLYSLSRRIYDDDTTFTTTGPFIDRVDNWFKSKLEDIKPPRYGLTKVKLSEYKMNSDFYSNEYLTMLMRSTPALFIQNSLTAYDTLWLPHLNGVDNSALLSISPEALKANIDGCLNTLQVKNLMAKKFCSQAAFEIHNYRVTLGLEERTNDPDFDAFRFWDYVRSKYL